MGLSGGSRSEGRWATGRGCSRAAAVAAETLPPICMQPWSEALSCVRASDRPERVCSEWLLSGDDSRIQQPSLVSRSGESGHSQS